jgi:hypothetical protein
MNEPVRLVAIGTVGRYDVYVGLTRSEAIARYNREHPDDDAADWHIQEVTVTNGHFQVYDIWADD